MVISTYTWQAKRSLAWFTAKRWIDERRREVSEYLKANVNTLKEVYRVLEMSPGLGDKPKDGYWNAPAHDRSARVFVEEEAGDSRRRADSCTGMYQNHKRLVTWQRLRVQSTVETVRHGTTTTIRTLTRLSPRTPTTTKNAFAHSPPC